MDVRFKITSLSKTRLNRCLIQSLFRLSVFDFEKIKNKTKKFVRFWRLKLEDLRRIDKTILGMGVESRMQYLRNCPPSVGSFSSGSYSPKSCKLSFMCPWCWSRRYTQKIYRKAKRAAAINPESLFYVITERFETSCNGKEASELLSLKTAEANKAVSRLKRRVGIEGGACLCYAFPSENKAFVVTKIVLHTSKAIDFSYSNKLVFKGRSAFVKVASQISYPYGCLSPAYSSKFMSDLIRHRSKKSKYFFTFGSFYL